MDHSEFETSVAPDESHHAFRAAQQTSQPHSFNGEPEQGYSDTHEPYSASHGGLVELNPATEEEEPVFGGARTRTDSSISATDVKQTISEMKQKLLQFEMRLASSSSNDDCAGVNGSISTQEPSRDLKVTFENSVTDGFEQPQIQVRAEMCERPWSDFMNKQAGENSEYAIEVLKGEPEYHRPKKDSEKPDKKTIKIRNPKSESQPYADVKSSVHLAAPSRVPERIRINSSWILNALTAMDRTVDATGPMVMLRPYKFLVHYESHIRDLVHVLRSHVDKLGTTASQHQSETTLESHSAPTPHELSMASQDTTHRQKTLQHMKCLVEFIDRYIKPTIDRIESNADGKIQFSDLWYIFRPGDDILMPLRHPRGKVSFDAVITAPEMFQSRYNMIWRVTGTGGGRMNLANAHSRNASLKTNPFKVNCYYIDFDGKFFCPTVHTFSIMPFKGERDITSLDFFPFRFLQEAQNTMKKHLDKGNETFKKITTFTHYYYVGPTLVVQPCGCPVQNEPLHQEHVESEIIVDFKTTLIKHPSWRPKPFVWQAPPAERRELQERNPVRYWSDRAKGKLGYAEHDHVYDDNYIDNEAAMIFRNSEQIFEPIPSGWLINESMVPEKDLILMPGRVFAFVLRTRTFAPLWLWLLQPIEPQAEGLRNLQLKDDNFKNIIQALVRTHFMQKKAHQASDFEYDVVRGKGKGLVILLHGAPGVGKTFTAGDLGLTPGEVERSLKEIFRYAQIWGCVLLLDECDIFLSQRSKNDIKRNSLVSVFLRVLEFYTGVLFLTTNRVGVLDDAIRSRITWIAYYPPLDARQTAKIWRVNIKLLEERKKDLRVDKKGILKFAQDHFASNAANKTTWNGRQIQNAFKVATALAEWDAHSKDLELDISHGTPEDATPSQTQLNASHFNTIAVGTQAFNDYLFHATGYTEGERAYNAMERADDFTVENSVYGNGNITVSPDNDRGHLPSLSIHGQHTFSASVASPPSYGRASSPLPNRQASRRRTSSAWQQSQQQQQYQPSLSSSRSNQDLKYLPPPSPKIPSRRPSNRSQATAIPDAMDLQSQIDSRRSSRDSYGSLTLSPPAPAFASLNSRGNSRQRSSSNTGMVRQDSRSTDDHRSDDLDDWNVSDDDNHGDHGRAEDQDEFLDRFSDEES